MSMTVIIECISWLIYVTDTKTRFTAWELPISTDDMINNFELDQAMSLIRERWRRIYVGTNMSVSQNIYLSLIYSTFLKYLYFFVGSYIYLKISAIKH